MSSKTTTNDKIAKAPIRAKQTMKSSFTICKEICLVKVGVGQEKTVFPINQNLLYKYSGYFIRAFGGTGTYLRESQTKIVELDEEDADAFSFINEWLYTQDIKHAGDITMIGGDEECSPTALMYINIYKLADYLVIPELQNMIMTRLYQAFKQQSQVSTYELGHLIQPCYERTLPDTPLRKWISHLYALGLGKWEKGKGMVIDGCNDFFTDYFLMKNICLNSASVAPMTTGVNKKQAQIYYPLSEYLVQPLKKK